MIGVGLEIGCWKDLFTTAEGQCESTEAEQGGGGWLGDGGCSRNSIEAHLTEADKLVVIAVV